MPEEDRLHEELPDFLNAEGKRCRSDTVQRKSEVMKSVSKENYEFIEGEGIPDCSRIGYTEDGFEVFVGTDDPGPVPHFHYRNADRSVNTSIQILEAAYYFLGKYRGVLDEGQRRNLQKFMCAQVPLSYPCTNWEYTAFEWNMNNPSDVRIDRAQARQPDYSDLTLQP